MRVKTFLRIVLGAALLAVLSYAGYRLWLQYNAASGEGSAANEQQIRHMKLEAQFTGPLQDTIVQRWSDPDSGNTCYIYLPVVVQHSKPLDNGLVHYGANAIGSISCFPAK